VSRLGLETNIVDSKTYDASVDMLREAKVVLPTFEELAAPPLPADLDGGLQARLKSLDPDAPDAANLLRVDWFNGPGRTDRVQIPEHLVIPESLSGVPARIVVLLGDRFPLIRAHKVLAAYGCLAPRLVTGQFDPKRDRAIWPSTGNYCRGGVAISRLLGCRGTAILPEGMSAERFEWLEHWVEDPGDIIRTPGSESNVKEIYDKCAELERDPENVIFNQFCEFGNHLAHFLCTGRAAETVFDNLPGLNERTQLRAFVSATGSAGTIAAGDYLKEAYGSLTVAVEALECPTLLYNGYGAHNIQGIGDKHVPFIHNVMGTDVVTAISDHDTDDLDLVLQSESGREFLRDRRGVPAELLEKIDAIGFSGICNVLAAIKTARYFNYGSDDVIMTVATDGAALYPSERARTLSEKYGDRFDQVNAAEVYGRAMLGQSADHLMELTHRERERIFNLGYFTWVEQQGVSIEEFDARRDPGFWYGLRDLIPAWDERILEFNAATGLSA